MESNAYYLPSRGGLRRNYPQAMSSGYSNLLPNHAPKPKPRPKPALKSKPRPSGDAKKPSPVNKLELSIVNGRLQLKALTDQKHLLLNTIGITGGHGCSKRGHASNGKLIFQVKFKDDFHGRCVKGHSVVAKQYLDGKGKKRWLRSRAKKTLAYMLIKKCNKWHLESFRGWDLSKY